MGQSRFLASLCISFHIIHLDFTVSDLKTMKCFSSIYSCIDLAAKTAWPDTSEGKGKLEMLNQQNEQERDAALKETRHN